MEEDGFILVSGEDDASPPYLPDIDKFIDSLGDSLWTLNKFIHANPELAFKEYKAHQALTDFLRSREEDWLVTPSAYGMETAWVAVYKSGERGPVVSFNVEMGMYLGT
jgi:metal-dependent amidase/aminoacylase/carboxypeptidase family protein